MEPREVVTELWRRMEARDWDGVGELVAEDFVLDWPESRERIRGRDNFVELNRNYPEGWSIEVVQVLSEGNRVVSEIRVPHAGLGLHFATSFFEVEDARIARGREYWVKELDEEAPGLAGSVGGASVSGKPQFVRFEDVRAFELAVGVTGRPLFGEGAMLNLIEFEPGAVVPEHEHPHEQLGLVLRGTQVLVVDGAEHPLGPMQGYVLPGGVRHSAHCGPEGATVLDVFRPVREDYLERWNAGT